MINVEVGQPFSLLSEKPTQHKTLEKVVFLSLEFYSICKYTIIDRHIYFQSVPQRYCYFCHPIIYEVAPSRYFPSMKKRNL